MGELRSLTPRQFYKLVERLESLDRPRNSTIELMTAQLIAMVGNTGFRGFEEPLQPKDFMPSLLDAKRVIPGKRKRKPSAKALSKQLERTMERAAAYQNAQVKHGVR